MLSKAGALKGEIVVGKILLGPVLLLINFKPGLFETFLGCDNNRLGQKPPQEILTSQAVHVFTSLLDPAKLCLVQEL